VGEKKDRFITQPVRQMPSEKPAGGPSHRKEGEHGPDGNQRVVLSGVEHRYEGHEGLAHKGPQHHDDPEERNGFPCRAQNFSDGFHEPEVHEPFPSRLGYGYEQKDHDPKAQDHGIRGRVQTVELNIVGNEEGPYAKSQGATQDEYGHGKTKMSACIGGNHASAGRMVHGGPDGPQRYK